MTEKEAIGRLHEWGARHMCGSTFEDRSAEAGHPRVRYDSGWAAEKYVDLLAGNVAALMSKWEWHDGDPSIITTAIRITHATIEALELDKEDQ